LFVANQWSAIEWYISMFTTMLDVIFRKSSA